MTKHLELYKCEVCGNIVQVMNEGFGELVCCNKPMTLLEPHSKDEEKMEKHVPYFTQDNKIQIGSDLHPATVEHHIDFIQTVTEDKMRVLTTFLHPTEEPVSNIYEEDEHFKAFEYCNIHGLWVNEK